MMTGVALVAAEIGDPDSTRTVIAIIALLVVLGLALIMVAFWLRRTTRPDPEFLAPLEAMGERAWRRGDPVWQRRRLDEVRPETAEPLKKAALPPRLDESFDAGPSGSGFDDLRPDEESTAAPSSDVDEQPSVDPTTAVASPEAILPDTERAEATETDESAADEHRDAHAEDAALEHDQTDGEISDGAAPDGAAADGAPADLGGSARPGVEPAQGAPGGDAEQAPTDDDRDGADAAHVDSDDGDADDMRTPIGSPRPLLDDLPESDIDPEVLERAMAELDAELQRGGNDG
jgi:hypothetical protein